MKWPVSLVADVHYVLSNQRFVALHLTRDASLIVTIPRALQAAVLSQHPCLRMVCVYTRFLRSAMRLCPWATEVRAVIAMMTILTTNRIRSFPFLKW